MKNLKNRGIAAIATVLGLGAIAFAQPANAQSTSRADALKDVRNAEIALQKERMDLRYAHTAAERADALKDIRNAEDHLRTEQADLARFGGVPSNNWGRPVPNRAPIFGRNSHDRFDNNRFGRNDRNHGRRW